MKSWKKFDVITSYLMAPMGLALIIMIWAVPLEEVNVETKIFFTIMWSIMTIGTPGIVKITKSKYEDE